jgi:putative ABC transport system substrate-binding protein
MRRRDFITLLGGTIIPWPLTARAQQPTIPLVGFLGSGSSNTSKEQVDAFHRGLSVTGYFEGQNVSIEYHWAEGEYDRLPVMAADLVRRKVAVIVAVAPAAALAAKSMTTTIPIVFVIGADPVGLGLVASLDHPGGNVTGVNFLVNALGGKRLQLICELVPKSRTVGGLLNPSSPGSDIDREDIERAAHKLGQKVLINPVTSVHDFEGAFTTMLDEQVDALVVSPHAFLAPGADHGYPRPADLAPVTMAKWSYGAATSRRSGRSRTTQTGFAPRRPYESSGVSQA